MTLRESNGSQEDEEHTEISEVDIAIDQGSRHLGQSATRERASGCLTMMALLTASHHKKNGLLFLNDVCQDSDCIIRR